MVHVASLLCSQKHSSNSAGTVTRSAPDRAAPSPVGVGLSFSLRAPFSPRPKPNSACPVRVLKQLNRLGFSSRLLSSRPPDPAGLPCLSRPADISPPHSLVRLNLQARSDRKTEGGLTLSQSRKFPERFHGPLISEARTKSRLT